MMGEYRNDPILKTLVVVLIGVLSFGLILKLYSGGGVNMGTEQMNMGGYGYGGGYGVGLIGGLILVLIKLFMIILVLALLGAIFVWFKNNFFKNSDMSIMQSINKDPILRVITFITALTFILIFILALFNSFSAFGRGTGGGYMAFNPMNSMSGLLTMLMQILSFVVIISLIMAVITFIKQQYEQGNLDMFKVSNSNQQTSINEADNTKKDIILKTE